MNTARTYVDHALGYSGRPVRAGAPTHTVRQPARVRAGDPILELAAENAQLREELAHLRNENGDLRASAALWIRCYEAARQRCDNAGNC